MFTTSTFLPRCFAIILTLCLFGVFDVALCHAQDAAGGKQFQQLKVNDKLKGDRSEVGRMLRDGVPGNATAKFDAYYKEYIFPQWTVAENFPKLAGLRKSLRSDFSAAKNADSYNRLLNLALNNLTTLATTPDFHPAVRFNAAVMLGGLNTTAPQRGANPVAFPKSLPVLVKLWSDPNENDAARFGALLGIVRHAEFNVDEASHPTIIDSLMEQATASKTPAGRSNAGHEWFRRKAIEGLGFAKGDQSPKVAKALAKIVNNTTESEAVRRTAAASLGKLTLTPDSGVNVSSTVRSLAKLASESVREEVEACEKDTTKILDPIALKMSLLPVRVALTGQEKSTTSPTAGLAAAAKDKDQTFLKNVWKPIEAWYGKLDNKDLMSDKPDPGNLGGAMSPEMMGMGMDMMGPGMGGRRGAAAGTQKTPARTATEELIEYFNLELKKMENLLGGAK